LTDEGKTIYRYTHVQAVVDGELVIMTPKAPEGGRIFASRAAHQKAWVDGYYGLVVDVLLASKFNRMSDQKARIPLHDSYDVVFGLEIRDDDKTVPCATVVLRGES
jgi:hypothetical protein